MSVEEYLELCGVSIYMALMMTTTFCEMGREGDNGFNDCLRQLS
jgi:hypothetical protein